MTPEYVEDFTPRVLDARPHTSFSQISTYLSCSWKYYLRYVKKIWAPSTLPLAVGSAGHAALEYNAKTKMRIGSDLPMADLLDKASDLLDSGIHEVEDETDADKGKAKDGAIGSLRYFRTRVAPAITPVGVEKEFYLDIDPAETLPEPLRVVYGKIDIVEAEVTVSPLRRVAPVTTVSVWDYKFVSRMRTQAEVDMTPQLTLYDQALEGIIGRPADTVGYRLFLPGNTKEPARSIPIYRQASELEPAQRQRRRDRLAHIIRSIERAIRQGIFMPTDDPKVCSWCPYRTLCQFSTARDDFTAAAIRETT